MDEISVLVLCLVDVRREMFSYEELQTVKLSQSSLAKPGKTWHDLTKRGRAWQSLAEPGKVYQDLAKPGKA
jgi:hypothetical protein